MIPLINVLTDEQAKRIHDEVTRILSEVGVNFEYEPAIELFKKHGFDVDGTVVKFTEDQLMAAVDSAPAGFTMQARNPDNTLECEDGSFILTPSYGPAFVYDGVSGARRNSTYDDYKNVIKLVQMSQNINSSGGNVVEPCDVPDAIRHMIMTDAHIKLSDKTFMGSARGYDNAKDICEIAAIMFGGREEIEKTPVLNTLINSITPLMYDERMTGALMANAEYGQSCMVSSLVMSGSTGPVTMVETLAIQIAECLAGIVLTQLVKPGAPVIMGSTSGPSDMVSMALSIGNAEVALYTAATSQMGRFYGIPTRGGGGLNDGILSDAQAGYESMLTLLAAGSSGTAYVLHAAGIMHYYNAFSYEQFVIDDEIAGLVKKFVSGYAFDEDRFVFDDVKEVGHGGHFLYQDSTLDYMHDLRRPFISSRAGWEAWNSAGQLSTAQVAQNRWQKQLEEYVQPEIDPAMKEEIDAYITKRSIELTGEAPELL